MSNSSTIKNKKLLKSGISYSVASTLSSVVTMLAGFANLRWLTPDLLGVWQSLTIIIAYLPFLQLGIQSGLNLELPIELGKGDKTKSASLVATAKSFALFLASILAVVGIGVTIFLAVNGVDTKIVFGAATVSFMAVVACFRLHFIATYRSANAFDKLSKIYLIDAFLNLCLLYFIYKYKYYGLLIYNCAKEGVMAILMYIYAPYRGKAAMFDKESFKILFKRGLFMSIYNQLKGAIESFPKILLLHFGGVLQVGLFTPALAVNAVMHVIPGQLAQFIHPQMGYKFGETGNAKDMWPYLKKMSLYTPIAILPFSIIGFLLMPFLLNLFPKYEEALWPVRILLIGFIFSINLTRGFLITIKAYKETLFLQGIDMFCLLVLPFLAIILAPFTIMVNMAIGMTVGYIISYVANYWVVRRTISAEKYNNIQSI